MSGPAPLAVNIAAASTMYTSGLSLKKVGAALGVSPQTITRRLIEAGATIHTAGPYRKYQLRHNAFEERDQESDYWLGFIMADGNVYKGSLGVTLNQRDAEHLDRLRTFLGTTSPITQCRNRDEVRFRIHSPELCESMVQFGIVPAKSLVAHCPSAAVANSRHFWRGVNDGDGCLTHCEGRPRLKMVGAPGLMGQFASFIAPHLRWQREPKVHTYDGRMYEVALSSGRAVSAARVLYEGANVVLPRKAAIAASWGIA